MGIQGLLKQLEPLAQPIDVGLVYRGKTVAVDVSVWLHKGAYGCAPDLVLGRHTTGYLAYVLARALALRRRGVNVVCVFDGPHTHRRWLPFVIITDFGVIRPILTSHKR